MKAAKRFLTVLLAIVLTSLAILTIIPISAIAVGTISILVTPTSGPVGALINVLGGPCTVGSTYNILFGSTAVTSGTVPVGGMVSTYFNVPVMARGVYPISISTSASETDAHPASFTLTPQIYLNSTSGSVGDQLSVNGNGFYSNTTISVYYDGVAQGLKSAILSDDNGQFSALFTVPQSYSGVHTITANDYGGISPGVSFLVIPKLTLSANKGGVGSSITASGTGFANSSALSFSLDNTVINSQASTDSSGDFSKVSIVIPEIVGGVHTLTVSDGAGNFLTADLSVTAVMTISPTTGPVGANVAVTDKGFQASSPISITYDGLDITTAPSSLTSDSNGSFTTAFKVPAGSSGTHVIKVSDGVNSISVNFIIFSNVSVIPTNGPVGTNVSARGSGFKANANITINYNNAQVGTTNANGLGNFATTFNIPSASTGTHPIVITDQTNTQTLSFSITPTAKIDSTSGYIGSDITINGIGFSSNRGVTITYDTSLVNLITPSTTDANGTFTATFKAPVSQGGEHLVTVNDGTNTATFKFTMDSTPPPVPTLIVPANLTKLGKIPTLSWTAVTDPSGVTYNLQISKDAAFGTLMLQEHGLISTAYTLNPQNPQEKLNPTSKSSPYYYWRVQAIDGASNESAWSPPLAFLVVSDHGNDLGNNTIYIIYGGVAIMWAAGGYFLWRLIKHRV